MRDRGGLRGRREGKERRGSGDRREGGEIRTCHIKSHHGFGGWWHPIICLTFICSSHMTSHIIHQQIITFYTQIWKTITNS